MKKVCSYIILIMCVLCSCSYINNKTEYEKGMKWRARVNYYSSEINQDGEIYSIQEINKDDDFDTLTTFLPNKYVMCIDIIGNTTSIYKNDYGVLFRGGADSNKTKKFSIKIYDIETNSLVKYIDVKKIIDSNVEIQVQGLLSVLGSEIYNGIPYVTVRIERNPNVLKKYEENRDMLLYINLEDESYFYKDLVNKYNKVVSIGKEEIFNGSLLLQNTSDASLRVYNSDYEGRVEAYLYSSGLPQNNKILYTKFSKLKKYVEELSKKNKKTKIEFVLSDNMTDEEIFRLFIQDGKDISFDGVIISAKDSIDGLPHKINNFNDFYKYMEPKEHLQMDLKPVLDN